MNVRMEEHQREQEPLERLPLQMFFEMHKTTFVLHTTTLVLLQRVFGLHTTTSVRL